METVIEIDLINEDDLFEKYNKKNISRDLINYIVNSTPHFIKKYSVKIVINNKLDDKINCIPLIIDGLKKEYRKNILESRHNNVVQIIYFFIGFIILFLASLIEIETLKELVLIGGWVFIWAMAELEIFSDTQSKKRRKILKKLLNCEIVEIKK